MIVQKAIIYVIGSFIYSALMYSVPVLATCSFAFHWHGGLQFVLGTCAFVQFVLLWWKVAEEGDE